MERTGKRVRAGSPETSGRSHRLHAWLFLLAGALALGGCYVVPAHTAYVAPAPVYVAPAPVYVAPAPVYRWGWGYGWRRGRW
jgi:PXPV repeat-containing protein